MKKSDLKGKKILFVAYFYPPVKSNEVPGAMRIVKFIRNLTSGECHVLTIPPTVPQEQSSLNHLNLPVNKEYIHRIDAWDIFEWLIGLRNLVKKLLGKGGKKKEAVDTIDDRRVFKSEDSDTEVEPSKFQQLKDFIHNLFYFPDQGGPWIIPAYLFGKKLVRQRGIDIIFATGSPWSGLLVGYLISKATGKHFIADFRDPWMNNPFHKSKGALLDSWSAKLEKKIVEHAAKVSLNTNPLMEEFVERFPHLSKSHFFVMPNGFDSSDFSCLPDNVEEKDPNILTLCHAGFLYGVRDPAFLLNAIRKANEELVLEHRMVRFRQIGNVSLAYDIRERYNDMIDSGSLILDEPRPYIECLSALKSADWVVNIQPTTKSQVPSKLYDYLAINRPILNITPTDGALADLVKKYGLGELFGFDDQQGLSDLLVRITRSRVSDKFKSYKSRDKFDYAVITQDLVRVIFQLQQTI